MKLTVLVKNTFLKMLTPIPMVSGTILSSMTPRERERRERHESPSRLIMSSKSHLGVLEDRMVPDIPEIGVNMLMNIF